MLTSIGLSAFASAHEGKCPMCKMDIVQNTKDQDNEVALKMGNKRIEYRCVYCAFKDEKKYKSDIVIYAPSEKKGEPVAIKRTAGKWSAPEGTVFLNTFAKHADCAAQSRAFTSKAALDAYAKAHKIEKAKALTLAEFVELVNKPKS